MKAVCAHCRRPVPAKRPGRKGRRVFCSPAHKKAFLAAAIELGREVLDYAREVNYPGGAEAFAKYWLSNFQRHSTGEAGSPDDSPAPENGAFGTKDRT